mmetsp:Transcript_25041/g.48981  ORF Transcript_25041/g.48981 Transcript_25041/m.48981 type:complete len:250 (-) Transcript_25041:1170-1919(-)
MLLLTMLSSQSVPATSTSKCVHGVCSSAWRTPSTVVPEHHNARRSSRGCGSPGSSCNVASVTPRPPTRSRRNSRQVSNTVLTPPSVIRREATVRSTRLLQPWANNANPTSLIELSALTPRCISLCGPSQTLRSERQQAKTAQASSSSGAKRERDRRSFGRRPSMPPICSGKWEPIARLRKRGSCRTNVVNASSVTLPTSRQESGKTRSSSILGKSLVTNEIAMSSTPWQPCTVNAVSSQQPTSPLVWPV